MGPRKKRKAERSTEGQRTELTLEQQIEFLRTDNLALENQLSLTQTSLQLLLNNLNRNPLNQSARSNLISAIQSILVITGPVNRSEQLTSRENVILMIRTLNNLAKNILNSAIEQKVFDQGSQAIDLISPASSSTSTGSEDSNSPQSDAPMDDRSQSASVAASSTRNLLDHFANHPASAVQPNPPEESTVDLGESSELADAEIRDPMADDPAAQRIMNDGGAAAYSFRPPGN